MKKILLVEDNEPNRDMLSRLLVRRGCDVLVAHDGASGVDPRHRSPCSRHEVGPGEGAGGGL